MEWIIISLLLLFVVYFVYTGIKNFRLLNTVTKISRGTRSERKLVLTLLKRGIPAESIFHDLYINTYKNNYSQIDLVVATKVGIIVFEVKEYNGWIYGEYLSTYWTKVITYGKQKYQFYNPIKQNEKHVTNLKKKLKQFDSIPFYSVIVFYGDCTMKSDCYIPENTFLLSSKAVMDVVNYILNNNASVTYTNKHEIIELLQEAVANGSKKSIPHMHIKNVNEMLRKRNRYY